MKALSIIGIILSVFGLFAALIVANPESTRYVGIFLVILFLYFLALSIVGIVSKKTK